MFLLTRDHYPVGHNRLSNLGELVCLLGFTSRFVFDAQGEGKQTPYIFLKACLPRLRFAAREKEEQTPYMFLGNMILFTRDDYPVAPCL